jgi:hypothetical protein
MFDISDKPDAIEVIIDKEVVHKTSPPTIISDTRAA